jgi:hypothetical protein
MVFIAIGVYFSVKANNKEPSIELSNNVTEQLLLQNNVKALKTENFEGGEAAGHTINKQIIDNNENGLIQSSLNGKVLQKELVYSGKLRQRENIEGVFDINAIAPEHESLQVFYDDAMQITVSNVLAPEAGSEMMPGGDGHPMNSESFEGAIKQETIAKN